MLDTHDEAAGVDTVPVPPHALAPEIKGPPPPPPPLETKAPPPSEIKAPPPPPPSEMKLPPPPEIKVPRDTAAAEIKAQPDSTASDVKAKLEATVPEIKVRPDPTAPEIKVQRADAILRSVPFEDKEKVSPRKGPSVFGRVWRFTVRTVALAGLCGLAWAGGAASGHSPFELLKLGRAPDVQLSRAAEVQQSPDRGDIVRTMAQMADEIRALKASLEGKGVAQAASVETTRSQESMRTQLASAQTATGTALADLASRVDRLESESGTKLTQVTQQLASIEQQIAASNAALAARAQTPAQPVHKRVHVHDAFDPSKDPNAPGAPHPLGTTPRPPLGLPR